jgi:hypothetical protein
VSQLDAKKPLSIRTTDITPVIPIAPISPSSQHNAQESPKADMSELIGLFYAMSRELITRSLSPGGQSIQQTIQLVAREPKFVNFAIDWIKRRSADGRRPIDARELTVGLGVPAKTYSDGDDHGDATKEKSELHQMAEVFFEVVELEMERQAERVELELKRKIELLEQQKSQQQLDTATLDLKADSLSETLDEREEDDEDDTATIRGRDDIEEAAQKESDVPSPTDSISSTSSSSSSGSSSSSSSSSSRSTPPESPLNTPVDLIAPLDGCDHSHERGRADATVVTVVGDSDLPSPVDRDQHLEYIKQKKHAAVVDEEEEAEVEKLLTLDEGEKERLNVVTNFVVVDSPLPSPCRGSSTDSDATIKPSQPYAANNVEPETPNVRVDKEQCVEKRLALVSERLAGYSSSSTSSSTNGSRNASPARRIEVLTNVLEPSADTHAHGYHDEAIHRDSAHLVGAHAALEVPYALTNRSTGASSFLDSLADDISTTYWQFRDFIETRGFDHKLKKVDSGIKKGLKKLVVVPKRVKAEAEKMQHRMKITKSIEAIEFEPAPRSDLFFTAATTASRSSANTPTFISAAPSFSRIASTPARTSTSVVNPLCAKKPISTRSYVFAVAATSSQATPHKSRK